MFYRVIMATACVLVIAACAGPGSDSPVGVTSPSSLVTSPSSSVAAPASAPLKRVDVPFSGAVSGEAAFDFVDNSKGCTSGFTTKTTAKGTATHMGLVTWQSEHCLRDGTVLEQATLVLTAANGDEVFVNYSGGSCTFDGANVVCTGPFDVTGGTGRFSGATGTGQFSATVVFEGFEDLSWPGRWEWKGTIRY